MFAIEGLMGALNALPTGRALRKRLVMAGLGTIEAAACLEDGPLYNTATSGASG